MNSRLHFALCLLAICAGLVGCGSKPKNSAFQNSTIPALMEGVYAGDLSLGDVRKKGDFGIGTLDHLDGELILLDGEFYQVRSDGTVQQPPLNTHTPFAVVCYFKPKRVLEMDRPLTYEQLRQAVDSLRTSPNLPCAIRITGNFESVQTRSVPRQRSPYRRLVDVTKDQPVFDIPKGEGTLVGYWFPKYLQGVNVPGYHLHYLTADHQKGGHVLDCRPTRIRIEVAEMADLALRLPRTTAFRNANLQQDRPDELQKVEQAPATAPESR